MCLCLCEFRAQTNQFIEWSELRQRCAAAGEFCDENFRGNVSDERILREWASPEAADCGVEAAAACFVGGADVCGSLIAAGVQMHADLRAAACFDCGVYRFGYLRLCCQAYRVCQRNLPDAEFNNLLACTNDRIHAPWIAVRISECHGDVSNYIPAGIFRQPCNRAENIQCFSFGLILISMQKLLRN